MNPIMTAFGNELSFKKMQNWLKLAATACRHALRRRGAFADSSMQNVSIRRIHPP
jgi:hypothetical protein